MQSNLHSLKEEDKQSVLKILLAQKDALQVPGTLVRTKLILTTTLHYLNMEEDITALETQEELSSLIDAVVLNLNSESTTHEHAPIKDEKSINEGVPILSHHEENKEIASKKEAANIAKTIKIAKEIAYTHHEKWDGTGYPQGLKGDAIPLSGRLMALADVYDALISRRIYKDKIPHDEAVNIIMQGRGSHFDPDILDAFIELQSDFKAISIQFLD